MRRMRSHSELLKSAKHARESTAVAGRMTGAAPMAASYPLRCRAAPPKSRRRAGSSTPSS
jgi:hypothetical protein